MTTMASVRTREVDQTNIFLYEDYSQPGFLVQDSGASTSSSSASSASSDVLIYDSFDEEGEETEEKSDAI